MELHSFDKQRNLAIDFPGNLKNISMMRSVRMVSSGFSSLFVEFEDWLLPWGMAGLCCKQACSHGLVYSGGEK